MAALPKLDETHLESLCAVVGDTTDGLTGSEIGRLLARCHITDPEPTATKRFRLFEALRQQQDKDRCGNNVLAFVQTVLEPIRFHKNPAQFEDLRTRVNEVLAFSGYAIGEDGKCRPASKAATLSEAQARASSLRQKLLQRSVHSDVLRFCRPELLQGNYFHAVFEATKSVAQKIREISGLTQDGAELVDICRATPLF